MAGDVLHNIFKIILGTFNFLIFVCGVLLLAFGIMGVASPQTLTYLLDLIPGVSNVAVIVNIPQLLINSSIYMIILGSVMVVFGFVGCFGIMRHSPFLLLLYWSTLVVLLLAEIGLIIFALVDPSAMQSDLQSLMLESLKANFKPVIINPTNGAITLPPYAVADAWISMQFEVGCCGALGPDDYKTFTWNNTFVLAESPTDVTIKSAVVPPSCCLMTHKNFIPTNINDGFVGLTQCLNGVGAINTAGCYIGAMDLLEEYGYIAVGIAAGIIFFQLIAIGTAVYEWRRRSKK